MSVSYDDDLMMMVMSYGIASITQKRERDFFVGVVDCCCGARGDAAMGAASWHILVRGSSIWEFVSLRSFTLSLFFLSLSGFVQ